MYRCAMSKRSPAARAAQSRYEATKLAAGEHVQVHVRLKASDDLDAWRSLKARHPDLSDRAIMVMAMREAAARAN